MSRKTISTLIVKWLARTPVERVVFEPTRPYHRAFGAAGVPFVKVNPRQTRRFAEAVGNLAKTDRLDAAALPQSLLDTTVPHRLPRSRPVCLLLYSGS
jgi:transposase